MFQCSPSRVQNTYAGRQKEKLKCKTMSLITRHTEALLLFINEIHYTIFLLF